MSVIPAVVCSRDAHYHIDDGMLVTARLLNESAARGASCRTCGRLNSQPAGWNTTRLGDTDGDLWSRCERYLDGALLVGVITTKLVGGWVSASGRTVTLRRRPTT